MSATRALEAVTKGYVLVDERYSSEPANEVNSRRQRFPVNRTAGASVIVGVLLLAALAYHKHASPNANTVSRETREPASPAIELAESVAEQVWEPHFLTDYPLAVCNDGSPAAYYYRKGNPNLRMWMVWLEGAGWCWDVHSCSRPWHVRLGTSKAFPRSPESIKAWSQAMEGIFDNSPQNPMQQVNVAYVRTCSNDAFMGDAPPRNNTRAPGLSWHFRGKQIIEAVFADLRQKKDMCRSPRDRIVYGGCSSGARGALMSLDWAAKELAGNASLSGLVDSPVWLPIEPLKKTVVSFTEQTQKFLNFTNATAFARGSEECWSKYAGEEWKCLQGSFRLPYIRTPYFLTQSQYDLFAISVNVFGRFAPFVPLNDRQREYAEMYRREIVKYLPTPKPGSGQTIYSTACYTHCSLSSHTFYSIRADGVGLLHLLDHWTLSRNPDETTGYLVDHCVGFNCGRQGAHPATTTTRPMDDFDDAEASGTWFPGWSWPR